MTVLLTIVLSLAVLPAAGLPGSGHVARPDTVELGALRAAAAARDPRAAQPALLARASRLRLSNLRSERLPQLVLTGQATLQSDVPSVPIVAPDGSSPAAPREQARLQVEADWALYDGGRIARRAEAERERLAEQTAGVEVELFRLREATTEAFFGALLYQAQAQSLALAAEDLAARLELTQRRAEAGAALAADAAALEAELIHIRQRVDEAEADRRAALAVLEQLTGIELGVDDVLAVPVWEGSLKNEPEQLIAAGRPEWRRLASTRARAEAEARLATAAARPTLSLFGQAGVGRPSPFDFLNDDVREYGLVGVRARWAWDWGRAGRSAEAARLQAELAQTEADAFVDAVRRETEAFRSELERIERALVYDARAITLREEVARVAERRLDEGVLLPADYADALTDLADTRLVAARHHIERAYTRARLLSALGRYPDAPRSEAPFSDRPLD